MAYPKYREHVIAFIEFIVKDDAYALFDPDDKLVATLKRHEYLSQPQLRRIGNSHGRYRKSSSPFRINPVGKSGSAFTIGTKFRSFSVTIAAPPSITNHHSIEDSGIRAGEITACRCWWNINGSLYSIYMDNCEWFPNTPMIGDVSSGYGVHAFKDRTDLFLYSTIALFNNVVSPPQTEIVTGTVSMWGEIVEHERGYRAQYAKIISLDNRAQYAKLMSLDVKDEFEFLRRKYGV